ncbi:MAG: hypothetical protein ACT4OP_09305 [Actinomycetota bacterium]
MSADQFTGLVRIYDTTGSLLTVGTAAVAGDEESGGWTGTLKVIDGTGVAGKALVVDLEMDGRRGRAQLIPETVEGDLAVSRIVGLSPIA